MAVDAHRPGQFDREFRPALLAYFQRRVRSLVEAEDLVQETFVRLATVDAGAVHHTGAYVFQIAANLIRDRARRLAVRHRHLIEAGTSDDGAVDVLDPHRIAAAREQVGTVTRALATLPERTRRIFLLFRYENIDQRTIADSFGISVSAVEKHVHRAMAIVVAAVADGL